MWYPPEVLETPVFHSQIDIWSFGVSIYFFLTGELPFNYNQDNNEAQLEEQLSRSYQQKERFKKLFPNARDLIDSMLDPDANSRLTIISNNKIEKIELYSMLGVLLKRVEVSKTNSFNIDISDLSVGLYSCRILTDNGTKYLKLIIQR